MNYRNVVSLLLASLAAGCVRASRGGPETAEAITPAAAMMLLAQLSDDSLRGRMTATPGADRGAAGAELGGSGYDPARAAPQQRQRDWGASRQRLEPQQ